MSKKSVEKLAAQMDVQITTMVDFDGYSIDLSAPLGKAFCATGHGAMMFSGQPAAILWREALKDLRLGFEDSDATSTL